jgi:hypothetical protein
MSVGPPWAARRSCTRRRARVRKSSCSPGRKRGRAPRNRGSPTPGRPAAGTSRRAYRIPTPGGRPSRTRRARVDTTRRRLPSRLAARVGRLVRRRCIGDPCGGEATPNFRRRIADGSGQAGSAAVRFGVTGIGSTPRCAALRPTSGGDRLRATAFPLRPSHDESTQVWKVACRTTGERAVVLGLAVVRGRSDGWRGRLPPRSGWSG